MMIQTKDRTVADLAEERVKLKRILRYRGVQFNNNESTDLLMAKVVTTPV